jgi:ribosomal small subunit protein bTHX
MPVYYTCLNISKKLMGRGDKKSKKGKRTTGSFGVSRNKNKIKARLKRVASKKKAAAASSTAKPKRAPRKKAEA